MTNPEPQRIRVMVVDDHKLFRRGLVALLGQEPGLEVVGEASDGAEALRHLRSLKPDVMLLDNHMPGVRGVDLLPGLIEASPETQFVMLTVSEDEQDLAAALRSGAAGYLLKTMDGQDLARAIHRVVDGESVLSPEMMGKLIQAFRSSASAVPPDAPATDSAANEQLASLSPRERDILREVVRGSSNKEIARTLGIAETTVKIHVQHVLRKLGLNSRVQMAVWGSERGV
ncbi:response regulator [Pelomonas sp. CA6]|uniref:response regulator n=1 Tax=Pelomonas sp. CA6 TaxID=2907999 RepID=UPI001F4AFFBC|nr:response regulator [Pelomonas sp. CA6]MCH7342342.1 response regulator [Pelomonas sp. CA6]